MNFLKKLFNIGGDIEKKSGEGLFVGDPFYQTRWSKTKSTESYNNIDITFKSIDLLASNFSSVPYVVYEIDSNGKERAIPNHPLQRLLNKPNALQTSSQFLYSMMAWRLMTGNGYAVMVTLNNDDVNEEPVAILSVPTINVSYHISDLMWRYMYNASPGYPQTANRTFKIDQWTGESNILNWHSFSTKNPLEGISPLQACNINVDTYDNAQKWNMDYFKNGCRPELAFTLDKKENASITSEQLKEFQKLIDERFSGGENNGKPLVLDSFIPQNLSTNAKDSDFINTLKKQEESIVRAFGIPPILLSAGEGATFNNQFEARLTLWRDTILQYIKSFTEEINTNISKRYGDNIIVKPDLSSVDVLNAAEAEKLEDVNTINYLTLNEKRVYAGYPEIEGGDVLAVSSGAEATDEVSPEDGQQ